MSRMLSLISGLTVGLLGLAIMLTWLADAQAMDRVTLQLKWKHQFQFAGYYAALDQGYYREAGLDVNIVEAQAHRDPVDTVLQGYAEFGVGTSELVMRRAQGEPVVVLAVIFQHSPLALLARRTADLNHVHDLVGKRVMMEAGAAELLAYLDREGVPHERLRLLPHTFDPHALIHDQVDAQSAYVTDELFLLNQAGIDYLIFTPRAAGIDFYGDNLFTTEAQIAAHPERVSAFRNASLRGWRYAMAHPEEIIELIFTRYSQRHRRAHLRYEAEQMQRLMQPELIEPGYMNPGRWRHIADTYAELGVLPADVSLAGFLYDPAPWVADLRRLYHILALALALAAVVSMVLLNIHRLNRRLRREIQERRTAEAKFRGLVEQSLVGIYIIQDGVFVYVNPKFAEIFGYAPTEIMSRLGPLDLTAVADRERIAETLQRRFRGEMSSICHRFGATRQDGALIEVEVNGKVVEYEGRPAIIGVALDITEQNRAQQRLNDLAFYDPLTHLPNRTLFFDRLEQTLAHSQRDSGSFAVLMVDLDGFKAVNDTWGHKTGDALLVVVGQRLRVCLRESDTVARMGGDEFMLILRNVQESDHAMHVAGKILAILSEPLILEGHECRIGASIGLCIAPEDGQDLETLLNHADLAMYQSKARGKNTCTRYRVAMLKTA